MTGAYLTTEDLAFGDLSGQRTTRSFRELSSIGAYPMTDGFASGDRGELLVGQRMKQTDGFVSGGRGELLVDQRMKQTDGFVSGDLDGLLVGQRTTQCPESSS